MRRTVVVDGPLAFHMRRIDAASAHEVGVQILSLPLLAARLAGGFLRPVEPQELDEAVRAAIAQGGLVELEAIRDLPGLARATAASLRRLWEANLPIQDMRGQGARWDDLALIERRVQAGLPGVALSPPTLRNAALEGIKIARAVLGDVELLNVPDVRPVWRPLLNELTRHVNVRWTNPGASDHTWFAGHVNVRADTNPGPPSAVESCANPKAEVIEALRWARELVASGKAKLGEIAICASSTGEWDSEVVVLAADARLPIHCSHGLPALRSWEGQVCAALGDVLLYGLSQARIRRLLGYLIGRDRSTVGLPNDWWVGIERGATLHTIAQWRTAIERAKGRRGGGKQIEGVLIPLLELLDKGVDAAAEAAEVLPALSRELLLRALQSAPPHALEYSLQAMRVPDDTDPGSAIVWGPARHLEAAPRPWVRMLGLTSRSWPRPTLEDPLLPKYLLPTSVHLREPRAEDERAFHTLLRSATGAVVMSYGRRSSQGTLQATSPLISDRHDIRRLRRSRTPSHAFSESDRLLARPADLAAHPIAKCATTCWTDWHVSEATAHDGRISAEHPILVATLQRLQSATSLQCMIRDPIAFTWRYGMEWRAPEADIQQLALPAADFGELVHALLKGTVDALEPEPGLIRAGAALIQETLTRIGQRIAEEWPLERSTPPALLWRNTLDHAAQMALTALTFDEFKEGTRAWSEVRFGWDGQEVGRSGELPWRIDQCVQIPDTTLRIRGSIDRVDLSKVGDSVRVTDYKSGEAPRRAVLYGRGGDLQRVLYAVAAKALLPGPPNVFARLVYLGGDKPDAQMIKGAQVDQAIGNCARFLNAAAAALRAGMTLPGPHPDQHQNERQLNELRIALPASWDAYCERKRPAIKKALGNDFAKVWLIE